MTVPCDTPDFPLDLVERLGRHAETEDAEIALAACPQDGVQRAQPVFCLIRATLLESLVRYTHGGGRKIDRWTALHRAIEVPFDDARAFFNANTLAELQQLQHG